MANGLWTGPVCSASKSPAPMLPCRLAKLPSLAVLSPRLLCPNHPAAPQVICPLLLRFAMLSMFVLNGFIIPTV